MIAAIGLRAVGLGNPLVGHQAWRQTDTWAVAQLMDVGGPLQPHVYWGGGGAVAMEAPIYSLLLALLGGSPIMGRALSLVISVLSVVVLHQLVRRTSGPHAANWAAGLYALLPMGLFYGRTVQPEALLMLGGVTAVWAFRRWLDSDWAGDAVLTAVAVTITGLTKPYGLLIGLPMAWMLVHERGRKGLLAPVPLAIAAVSLAVVAAWYAHAAALGHDSGLAFFSVEPGVDKWGHPSLLVDPTFWKKLLVTRIGARLLAVGAVPLVLYGLWHVEIEEERVFEWWLVGCAVYIVFVARGNDVHDYYQLPLLAPLCAIAGRGASRLMWRNQGMAVVGGCMLVAIFQTLSIWSSLLERETADDPRLTAAAACQSHIPDSGRVVVVAPNHDPTLLNLCQRRGWVILPHQVGHDALLELRRQGAGWLVATEPLNVEGRVVWSEGGMVVELPPA